MGQAKHEWMRADERGFTAPDTQVCDRCVEDPFLKDLVRNNAGARRCDYCHWTSRKAIAADAETVIEAIGAAVHHLYADPTHAGVPYDDGFVVTPTDSADVLMSLPLECHQDFFDDVVKAFGQSVWVRAGRGHWAAAYEHESLHDSWSAFAHAVKHHTRFHFGLAPNDPDAGPLDAAPGAVLPEIGILADDLGLIAFVNVGTVLYRARIRRHGETWPADAGQLGAPPSDRASAGRINPAGISYFYAARGVQTALKEVALVPTDPVAIAQFVTTRRLAVLDLCNLPAIPSLFDAAHLHQYEWLTFLRGFVEDISQPVQKDGREHIDYVPTQVLCEWFAQVYRSDDKAMRLDGIQYPSAVMPGGKNIVLFPTSRRFEIAFGTVQFRAAKEKPGAEWVQSKKSRR
jgi:RES domain-containing protein